MHKTLGPIRHEMDNISHSAHYLAQEEPEEIGLTSETGRYSGYKTPRGTPEKGAVGAAAAVGSAAGYVGGATLLGTLLGGPVGAAMGLVIGSATAPVSGAITGAVTGAMLGDKEMLTPEEKVHKKRRQRIDKIKQERFETGKGPIRGTVIGKISSMFGD